ncbi:hypothetical protein ACGF07_07840 [Kitasatospora sp. NPDC048194]|uniref:hypothetical protein n=1 Tax=Kitasatospora sp. NPDC048194 TaxID=3364045 RepID=UPI003710E300
MSRLVHFCSVSENTKRFVEQVSTGARIGHLKAVEKRLDLDELVEALLANVQVMRPGQEEEQTPAVNAACAVSS